MHRLHFERLALLILVAILKRIARHDGDLNASERDLIEKAEGWGL
jgi:hypothetical protein